MRYAQFCPIAKAAEMLGDRWSLLIIREMLSGGSRFNELQRGLGAISPTMLTKRLNALCDSRLVVRRKLSGLKGYEYYLTQRGQELFPILEQMGEWGMRWAREGMPEYDLDPGLLMLYLERSVIPDQFSGAQTVVRFYFTDLIKYQSWWLLVEGGKVDTCVEDPGREVDIYVTTDLRTMIKVWMGDLPYNKAVRDECMKVIGPSELTRELSAWIKPSLFNGIAPAEGIIT